MNVKRSIAVLLSAALLSNVAYADPPTIPDAPPLIPGEKDVGKAMSPMRMGQVAPFTGVLLSPLAIATIIAERHAAEQETKIEVDKAVITEKAMCEYSMSEFRVKCNADKEILQIQLDTCKKEVETLTVRLNDVESNSVSSPGWLALSGGAGLVIGVGITLVSAYAVVQATK